MVKCTMIHEGLNTVNDRIQLLEEDKLIHEHYFLPAASQSEGNQVAICCATYGDCYSHICGKLLLNSEVTVHLSSRITT